MVGPTRAGLQHALRQHTAQRRAISKPIQYLSNEQLQKQWPRSLIFIQNKEQHCKLR